MMNRNPMDLDQIGAGRWNAGADEFNQWEALGRDEKDELIAALPTAADGLPIDPKGDPDLRQELSIALVLALDGQAYAELNPGQLRLFEYYRVNGQNHAIAATLVGGVGEGQMSSTVSVIRV